MEIFDFLDKNNIKYSNLSLIKQAFLHTSYVNEHPSESIHDNERLEFMGDAVLQIYSAERLYAITPSLSEGKMSAKRASLVCEKSLSEIVREFELNKYLKLGQGEEKTGGRNKDSILGDMFEAFIGAVYLDSDIVNAYKLLDILMKHHIHEAEDPLIDYKTRLQEFVQADTRKSIIYETVEMKGPSNKPRFKVVCKIDDLIYGEGTGLNKKDAQKEAAKSALNKLAKGE